MPSQHPRIRPPSAGDPGLVGPRAGTSSALLLVAGLIGLESSGCTNIPGDDRDARVGIDYDVRSKSIFDRRDAEALAAWLTRTAAAPEPAVQGLYFAYVDGAGEAARPWFLSTMVSSEVARFWLEIGENDRARAVGDALLRWQHTGEGPWGPRLEGAFPSEIALTDGVYQARYLYD